MILVNLTTILVKHSIALTRKVVKMLSTAETKPRREYPCGVLLATGSVSRVLSSTVIYLGASLPVRSSHLLGDGRASLVSSAVLLRIEFTATGAFTRRRVRSYRTFPPLPERAKHPPAVSLCCTFPQIALGGRYPLSLPCGARTFLMRGLSALRPRLSDPVAHVLYFICRKKSNRLQFLSHADIIQAGIFSERLWI